MPDVQLPRLADTLVEGTVSRWLKRPGEHVARGEPLVEIETDKVNSEIESPFDGVLTEILVGEGETVPVGQVIARIDGAAAAGGAPPAVVPEAAEGPRLSGMRRRIAERMQEARAEIPQGAVSRTVDVSGVRREGGWTACFVKAVALAGGFASVGVAVEVPDGLVVPVVRGADRKSVAEISEEIAGLAERARANRLRPEEVREGQFTVTNVGSVGTLLAFPLVNPGQPGILAPGAIADGRCRLTLCYDRRALDETAADDLLGQIAEELGRL
jgi:2-oxoglutarate dehydrogenase E2 component (dihydrolipoamide succinyltransferase)